MAGKLASREGFTLEDFLEQMLSIRKMGPIANLLGMLPGRRADEGSDQADRRPRPRPHRGDHPVDDPGRAGQLEDHQRARAGCGSPTAPASASPTSTSCWSASPQAQKMMGQMAGSMGLPGMGPMSKKARGRQMQAQSQEGQEGQGEGPGPPADGCARAARGSARRPAAGLPARHAGAAPGAAAARPLEAELRPVQGRAARPVTAPPAPRRGRAPGGGAPRRLGARRAVHLRAGARRGDGQPRAAGCCRGWSTRTATSASAPAAAHVEDLAGLREQALADRAAGVLALRDCGSPVDTRVLDDEPDLPRIIRAGRHIAAPRRYIPGLGHRAASPAELVAEVRVQARRGDGWVKLVGDWIDRDLGDLAPEWPRDGAGRGDRGGARGGGPGHRAHLRHRRAARPASVPASTASSTAAGSPRS